MSSAKARFRRWRHQFRRRRGPLVRTWSADWRVIHTEPVSVEPWPVWTRRQLRRLPAIRR